jgi:hypothetical protein
MARSRWRFTDLLTQTDPQFIIGGAIAAVGFGWFVLMILTGSFD